MDESEDDVALEGNAAMVAADAYADWKRAFLYCQVTVIPPTLAMLKQLGIAEDTAQQAARILARQLASQFHPQPIDYENPDCEEGFVEYTAILALSYFQAEGLAHLGAKVEDVLVLSVEESQMLRAAWRSKFIPPKADTSILHRCPSCNHGKEEWRFDWHVFSYKQAPAERLDEDTAPGASLDFLNTLPVADEERIIVMWEQCNFRSVEVPFAILRRRALPTDCYYFPRSLTWTFVQTHEQLSFFSGSQTKRAQR